MCLTSPCAVLAGAMPVVIDLKEENEFRLTAKELEEAITDKTKILVLPFLTILQELSWRKATLKL